jgi:hypothetical protein
MRAAVFVLAVGCAPEQEADSGTPPDVPIVRREIAPTPEFSVGEGSDGGPTFHNNWPDVTRLSDGRIIVPNGDDYLYVFDAAGRLLERTVAPSRGPRIG